jgi:AraC-like DNA-binding protein
MGADPTRLLESARLAAGSVERAGERVDLRSVVTLWSDVGRCSGRADVGLELAERESSAHAFGVVGFRAMTSHTLHDALMAFVRHCHLVAEGSEAHVLASSDTLTFELVLPYGEEPVGRWMADRGIASCLVLLCKWTGEPLSPRRVTFRHAAPADTSSYERAFDCAVGFGRHANTITFEREVGDLRLRTSQADVASYLDSVADAAAAELPRDDAGGAASQVVRLSLSRGAPSLPEVARRLGVSVRTLQRRLLSEGLTYARVVDGVRRDTAVRLVTSTTLPLADVCEKVGFADERAFRRAFRRWTGSSPAELRREP